MPGSETKTRNDKILTEVAINRCQQVLNSQYKPEHVRHGFWIAYLAKTKKQNLFKYCIMKATTWVVVSSINCAKNKVNYYENLFYGRIKDHVKTQIWRRTNVRACQRQLNSVDCGFYTVANIFHLLSWINLSVKKIYENHIRPHLLTCVKSGNFNEFPFSKPGEKVIHYQEKYS